MLAREEIGNQNLFWLTLSLMVFLMLNDLHTRNRLGGLCLLLLALSLTGCEVPRGPMNMQPLRDEWYETLHGARVPLRDSRPLAAGEHFHASSCGCESCGCQHEATPSMPETTSTDVQKLPLPAQAANRAHTATRQVQYSAATPNSSGLDSATSIDPTINCLATPWPKYHPVPTHPVFEPCDTLQPVSLP